MSSLPRLCPNGHGTFASECDVCLDCGVTLVNDRRGRVVGNEFRLDRLIGLGGMRSAVWEAVRIADELPCAVKIAEMSAESDEARRLLASAALTWGLEHPNLATVYAIGETDEGEAFVAMELLKGRTLQQVQHSRGPFALGHALHVVREILGALALIHSRQVVHRDIKPANIHLSQREGGGPWRVRLIDFGVAKRYQQHVPDHLDLARAPPGQHGPIIGTPEYMAPEQVLGIGCDPRSDLYQTGIVLSRLLTGELPFQGKDRMAFYEAHLRAAPRVPAAVAGQTPLPEALVAIIARALAKHPAERFATAREFLTALSLVR